MLPPGGLTPRGQCEYRETERETEGKGGGVLPPGGLTPSSQCEYRETEMHRNNYSE